MKRRQAQLAPRAFRDVMGRFATGVAIMTTLHDGAPHGMTANAVSSVSLQPLLVLVCVERGTTMAATVTASGIFALSFLHEDDDGLAVHFADPYRPLGAAQFERIPFRKEVTGAPVLERGVAYVDCRTWRLCDGGDHLIVVGEVVTLGLGDRDDPLLFYRGAYRSLRPEGS
ncbi:MAG TPA: flavin reductase family protein [Nitriliruptorales bacterium]|nr:flavin reductase family protein [Nitriliruptorales bacterium]